MKKMMFFLLFCTIVQAASPQLVSRSYRDKPMSKVLVDLRRATTHYKLSFIHNELEDYTVTKSFAIPGTKAYFTQPKDIAETTSRVYFYEKEAVKLSQSIKRTVFHNMSEDLKLSEKFHFRYFALHIEDLAKAAVKVAEQLSVMAIKRSL